MKLTRIFIVAGAFVAPVAYAQINQILGVIHSAQNAVTQSAQAQTGQTTTQEQDQQDAFRAAQAEREQAGRQRAQQMVAEQDAKDIQKYKESQQRDQHQAQQQLDAARKIADICPDLTNTRFNVAERVIRCRNKGLTEPQQMTFVGGLPVLSRAYAASMVQDVYEDNVTDPGRGKAISDYYEGCYQRGTPCVRPKW